MSVQKIAKLAGVSVATVSRVLNDLPSVKPENKTRVLEAIAKLNYRPNLLARQLRTSRTGMLLVMVSNISNPFCAAVVKGIEEEAETNGYRILLCNTESDIERAKSCLQLLSGKMVDGVITMDAVSKLAILQEIIGTMPWVQCAEYNPNSNVFSVGIDDISATEFAIDRLIAAGKSKIALINHDLAYRYAQLREQAYFERLKHHRLAYHRVFYTSALSYTEGSRAASAFLEDSERPDAIFAVSDVLAAGALKALREKHIVIPEEIAVIGFDGVEMGEITSPTLSTIRQPSQFLGRRAVSLLLSQIETEKTTLSPVHELLPWDFLARKSG